MITVSSSDLTYEYSVDTVSQENANSAAIPLTVSGSELTLSTCDSFATKSDRFVVTATLVDSHPIGS
jgi:sortase (surface protein transpeptidase)